MKPCLVILGFMLCVNVDAQPRAIPRDTSFTVYGTFIKEVKKFPFIKIADPVSPGVTVDSNIVYSRPGGRELRLDIFNPPVKPAREYPVVLMVHGGGWRSGDRSHNYAIARQLALHRYIAVAVEYRLSLEAPYPAGLVDLTTAIRYLRANATRYHVQKEKIAVMGFSSGGQMAALLGANGKTKYTGPDFANESDRVQAAIDVDGILAFKHPESAEGAVAAQWLGGSMEEKPAVWAEASALSNVNKQSAPILFINSSLPRFHAGRDDMIRKLDSLGIYSEVHAFPDTPHPFWFFDPWFEPTVGYTVAFLDRVFGKK